MGLFDGGFDLEALTQMLNPIGSAAAAGGVGPNGAPIGMPTEQQLLNSAPAQMPMAPPQVPEIPPPTPVRTIPQPSIAAPVPPPAAPATPDNLGAVLAGNDVAPLPPAAQSLEARAPAMDAEGPTAPGAPEMNAQASQRPSLAQALKGVKAPEAPVLQKISTPNAPRATGQIKAGDLQALLMALNAGGGAPGKPVRLGG